MIPFMKKYPLPQEDAKQIVRLIASANTNLATLRNVPDMEANIRECEAQVLEGTHFHTDTQWWNSQRRQPVHCVPWPLLSYK